MANALTFAETSQNMLKMTAALRLHFRRDRENIDVYTVGGRSNMKWNDPTRMISMHQCTPTGRCVHHVNLHRHLLQSDLMSHAILSMHISRVDVSIK